MLATLDSLGMLLLGATLTGNGGDSSEYLPTWRKMTEIIGHREFLYLADSKASTWENRAKIHAEGGIYCFPLAMTQPRPKLLADWVKNPPTEVEKIVEKEEEESAPLEIGNGFEIPLGNIGVEPETEKKSQWDERWLVIKSNALASRQIKGLMFLLTIALRVFTLMEFVVRRQLHQFQSGLAGLYEGNPKRTTERPTAEKMLRVFRNITLYIYRDDSIEISGLNLVQQQILRLMNVPESIYTAHYFASG